MFADTFRSASPPPTEKTRTPSPGRTRDVSSQAENVVSQPSSLVRAVSSDDVVGRRIGLEPAQLAEVVDRMSRVPGRATDAEDEQSATAITDVRQSFCDGVDVSRIEARDDVDRLGRGTGR